MTLKQKVQRKKKKLEEIICKYPYHLKENFLRGYYKNTSSFFVLVCKQLREIMNIFSDKADIREHS